jgi:hypothetical protein
MTRAPRERRLNPSTKRTRDCIDIPTVASLGVQVRLVPIDIDRERQLTSLVASCETLRAEWESLFQQIIHLLNDDVRRIQDGDRSARPFDR